MEIGKEKIVTVEYTLKDKAGNVIDTSKGRGALTYMHGVGHMIPGFETALEGKGSKESLSFSVEPLQGYGERNDAMLFPIPKDKFQDPQNITIGMQVQVQTEQGATVMTVAEVSDQSVVLDANHPLAGKELFFDVEILDVRDATEAELKSVRESQQGCSPTCCESCSSSCSE